MNLLNYLNEYFFTKQQLLDVSKITPAQLESWQAAAVMPLASYRVKLAASCDSFFGPHSETEEVEFYAKGYASWMGILATLDSAESAKSIFTKRYKDQIVFLNKEGFASTNSKINSEIDAHILQEWQSFLKGTYGLCTKSGLPEDIASKEFAIIVINEMTDTQTKKNLTSDELTQLTRAVNLLDEASTLFAPHERDRSSRHRLVNGVRQIYQLANNA